MSAPSMPYSEEAERGVIGSMFLEPVAVLAMLLEQGITKDAFYVPKHAILADCCFSLNREGKPIEFITIATWLKDKDLMKNLEGPGLINELFTLLPSAANVRFYLEDVQDKWLRRRLIASMTDNLRRAYATDEPTQQLAAGAQADIGRLIVSRSLRKSVEEELREIVDEVANGRDEQGVLSIHVEGINDRLKVYRGDLLFITAPTSCGKTALGAQLLWDQCQQGARCAVYPLEMRQKRVLKRAIAQLGGNNPDFVRKCVKSMLNNQMPEERVSPIVRQFMETAQKVKKFKLHMRDDLSRWEQIQADIRTEHAKDPFAFIFIDYLQLIKSDTKHDRDQLAIAEITQNAKRLAMALDAVICIPCQVNKEGGTRGAQDPEMDADALIKIAADADENGDPKPGRITVWKQRDGDRHLPLPLKFNPTLTRFEYAEITEPAPTTNPHPAARRR